MHMKQHSKVTNLKTVICRIQYYKTDLFSADKIFKDLLLILIETKDPKNITDN